MKIAVVGKGGSGKSSVSWLFSQYISREKGYVAAIDSDHNMDLTSLLGFEFDYNTPTFHRLHDEFREFVKQKEDRSWYNIVLDNRTLPKVTLQKDNKDDFSKKVFNSISDSVDLAVVGLGGDDILYSSRCAHGHSAPLKYYLPLIDNSVDVVVDGVAGVDMIHAGIYLGVDVLAIVVEPQPNSVRVCDQIVSLAKKLSLPYGVVINKPNKDSKYYDEIISKHGTKVVGVVPIDTSIMESDYSALSQETKDSASNIYNLLQKIEIETTGLERLKKFESEKLENRS